MTLPTKETPWVLGVGDCIDGMKSLPENSIDAVVCDPPYDLTQVSRKGSPRKNDPNTPYGRHNLQPTGGFMGHQWDATGIAFKKETWEEAYRVMKPGAHLLCFGGSRTFHRLTCAIEDAGFEIRDCIMWMYATGFPKSYNVGLAIDKLKRGVPPGSTKGDPLSPNKGSYKKEPHTGAGASTFRATDSDPSPPRREFDDEDAKMWSGYGTAIKPGYEPIVLARKPCIGNVAKNILTHGTGALNIDGCRVSGGRLPANVLLSHTEDCVLVGTRKVPPAGGDILREATKSVRKNNVYGKDERQRGQFRAYKDEDGMETLERYACVPECPVRMLDSQTGITKTKRIEKPSDCETETGSVFVGQTFQGKRGARGYTDIGGASRFFYCAKASRKERSVGLDGIKNIHSTVKPLEIMKYLCRLVTPPDGIVLDPFVGSGTTGAAALIEGFRFIGFEKEPDYAKIAERRIRHWGKVDGIVETVQKT